MKKILLFFSLVALIINSSAQMAMGTFRTHLSCQNFYSLAITPNTIYAAAQKQLMLLDKNDNNTLSSWSKVDGLSEVEIEKIAYDSLTQLLIVAYSNANLDFIDQEGNLINVNDIKLKSISGSKSINHIFIQNKRAYFSCGFGVVVVDLEKFVVIDTWFSLLNGETFSANALTCYQNNFYLTTPNGVFTIHKDNPQISDFTQWTFIPDLGQKNYTSIQTFGKYLIVNQYNNTENIDSIYVLDNLVWRYAPELFACFVRSFDVQNNELLICDWELLHVYDTNLNEIFSSRWIPGDLLAQGRQACLQSDNTIWVADQYHGLSEVKREPFSFSLYSIPGPANDMAATITNCGDITLVSPHSLSGYAPTYSPPVLSIFKNEKWSSIIDPFYYYSNPYDFCNAIANPKDENEIYVASWMGGLFKINNGVITAQFDSSNSPLSPYNESNLTCVSGLAFDINNNLWVTNSKVSDLLAVRKTDGSWQSFSLSPYISGGVSCVAKQVIVDSRNYKWIALPRTNLNRSVLLAFFENNTIDNKADDKMAVIDVNSAANIQTLDINCIAEDKNGYIWLGTDRGVKVVYNASLVFNSSTQYARNIFITQDGYTQNLLEFETVTCIAVDGANRKWIGTSKAGVFLISDNGTEELLHFTQENSPLLSNQINTISINHITGEVFFGTANGIISYQGAATEGKESYDDVKVFPNPVKSGYSGYVTVVGLKANSFCKIADANGLLVWQGYAKGGTLTWNCKDLTGKRPATGVYFVFSSDENGKKRNVAKILFIN